MAAPTFVKKVVKTCLGIKESDKVTIFAWRHMIDLAEAFAMECKRSGAHAHIEFLSDEMWYDAVTSLPLSFLETPDPFDLALAEVATATIFFSGPASPEKMIGVPAERWMALSRADKPYYDRILKRKIRSAEITLGHVTPQRAKTYGFNYEEWDKNVREATDVKYEKMRQLGHKFADILEKSREVEITNPDGTSFYFALDGRKAHVHDGVIDEEDVKMGAIFASFPDGTVVVSPNEESAKGKLVSNIPYPQAGLLIEGISLDFDDGKLVSFTGGKNIKILKSMWEKATGDKDKLGSLALGLNPKAAIGFTYNQVVLGTVTIGIGLNKELEGKNESDWGLPITLKNPTLKLDGKTIIKQGKPTSL